jgi:hypothetical protein
MVMTYNSLVQQVQDELDRYDTLFVSYIPNLIYQATDRINADLKNIGLEQYVTGTFIANAINGGSVIPKPARWRRTITFNYGTGVGNNVVTPILLRTYEFCRNYSPNASVSAPPLYYADYGFYNYLIVPTPDQAYPFELAYLEVPETITANVQTNWITNYAPSLYLYAVLLEAVIYLNFPERIPSMQAEYEKRLAPLAAQDQERKLDRETSIRAD